MRTISLVFTLAIALCAATAHADDVGVVVTGEATLQPTLSASLESWLRHHGHKLVSSPLEADATNALIDCFVLEDLGCARTVIEKRAKAQAVVYTRIDVTPGGEGMGDVTLVGYWLQKGHDPVGERRTCSHCNAEQLANTAEDLMTALAAEPPPVAADAPKPVAPPVVAAQVEVSDETRPSQLPKVVIGAGAALAITGVVLVAMDGPPGKTGVQQPTYTSYKTPGYALVATGVVVAAAGAYWWYRSGHNSAPVAAITPDGAVVGWAGRF
ncbi:MAG TPA: hypothetical protein VGF94_02690 [Kofleriaceae bacterium]|jgi:hypothetical protein